MESTDRIEKSATIRAPRDRVWRALTDQNEFGEWFSARLSGPFETGKRVTAVALRKGHPDLPFSLVVDQVMAPRFLSWLWNPAPIDPSYDYSKEPMTLVEFTLDDVPGGTKLTVRESGFDQIPETRRKEAFQLNSDGWKYQMENIDRHVQKDR